MRRVPWRTVLVLAPALALVALTLNFGCNSPTNSGEEKSGGAEEAKPKVSKEKKELESKGWGNLKGKVTLDGPAPEGEIKKLNDELKSAIEKNNDKGYCLSDTAPGADKEQQSWRIGKDGAVQNVVVFLKPPAGTVFKIDMDNPTWDKVVTIKQPFCAFEPHVATIFPAYYDLKSKGEKPSGQKFEVQNNSKISHNTAWSNGPNPGDNVTLPPGQEPRKVDVVPSYSQPLNISCKIHGWMNGYVWALEHPYAAVTNEKGEYEIKHAPAGAEVNVVAWHERALWVNGQNGEKIKLEDGKDTTKDFKVKAK